MGRKGFTLIEVLIALVLVVLVVGIMGYFNGAFLSTQGAQRDTQAQTFARSYFDYLRSQWVVNYGSIPDPKAAATPKFPTTGYTYSTPVLTPISPSGATLASANLIQVDLTITGPRSQTYVFRTQIARTPTIN